MTYTTYGLMTAADLREYEEDHDLGTVSIDADQHPGDQNGWCPLMDCTSFIKEHDWFDITRAGGTVVACSETS